MSALHGMTPQAWGLLALALLGSLFVHWPALHSEFRHDDWLTFYQAANLRPLDFMLLPHGGHLMMTRNAIHLVFFELFDLNPSPYFIAAVATHLLNVGLLFLLALRLGGSAVIAAFAAALWGMAPVQQVSVNWVALYGNMNVATFTLWPLAELAQLAVDRRPPTRWALARWGVMLAAAATSFGPGFAAALIFWAVAWLFLPRECERNRVALGLFGVTLALVAVYLLIRPGGTAETVRFWFTAVGVQAVAQAFVGLWSYGIACLFGGAWLTWGEEGVPLGPLQGVAAAGLVQISWAFAAAICASVLALWLHARELQRRQMLALLLLVAAIHGLVALARGPLGLWLLGLDNLVLTARYQYVATAAWSACLALALAEAARGFRSQHPGWRARAWVAPGAFVLWTAALLVPYASAARHMDLKHNAWSRQSLEDERARLEQAIAAAPDGSEVRIENRTFAGMGFIQGLITPSDFPGTAAVFLFLQHNAANKHPNVRFVESDSALVEELRARRHTRVAELLLTADEAAATPAQE